MFVQTISGTKCIFKKIFKCSFILLNFTHIKNVYICTDILVFNANFKHRRQSIKNSVVDIDANLKYFKKC